MSNAWNHDDVDEWAMQPEVTHENAQETPREANAYSSHRRHPSSGQGRGRGRGRGDTRSRMGSGGGGWGSSHHNTQSKQETKSYGGWGSDHGAGECAACLTDVSYSKLDSKKSADQTVGSDGYAIQELDPSETLPKTKAADAPLKDPSDELYDNPNIKARDPKLENKLFGASQTSGINFDMYNSIDVKVEGDAAPPPISTFDDPLLHPLLRSNIRIAGYDKPTPIQRHSIAIVNAGRDLIACAQTGSGKTAAFLFPILSENFFDGPSEIHAAEYEDQVHVSYPTTLILAPTRELAVQIHDEAAKFCYRSWIKTAVVYGGQPIEIQTKRLAKGCDLLVATPGRLVDLIDRGSENVKNIKYLILDEADRMLDMGFGYQVRRILGEEDMHSNRQTLLFSATFPKIIENLAILFMSNYLYLTIGRVGSTSTNIAQEIIQLDSLADKRSHLLDILETMSTIQKNETKKQLTLSFANSLHGGRIQQEREQALSEFRKGVTRILVATDIASRGLDVPNVNLVINFDLPSEIDDYVHRIGRTGRAGHEGKAVSYFTQRFDAGLVGKLVVVLMEAGQDVPAFFQTRDSLRVM
ncbi:DEAD-box ATP-dependent RNA helicase [Chytriomyces hyalinus]|nr:DEAD-box ATP-dependent RNA helicase [Chytriomyces hyalinus]